MRRHKQYTKISHDMMQFKRKVNSLKFVIIQLETAIVSCASTQYFLCRKIKKNSEFIIFI
jgi:hypothetical protein